MNVQALFTAYGILLLFCSIASGTISVAYWDDWSSEVGHVRKKRTAIAMIVVSSLLAPVALALGAGQ